MTITYKNPKGTFDILPDEWRKRNKIQDTASARLEGAGYGRIETPVFEQFELFNRSVGEDNEVVKKEMYTFADRSDRKLALRPEGTAAVARAFETNGMKKWSMPVRLWYSSSFFRYEAVQAGRQRQFWQIGAETIGSDSEVVEAESIFLLQRILDDLNINASLSINMLPEGEAKQQYIETLKSFLYDNKENLPQEIVQRIETNPLRAFDNKDKEAQKIMSLAPTPNSFLDRAAEERFAQIQSLLDAMQIKYVVDPCLVRGLDYYTGFLFEFSSKELGAQSGIAGGGRYNNLLNDITDSDVPAFGWGLGVERILLLMETTVVQDVSDFYLVYENNKKQVMESFAQLSNKGFKVAIDVGGSIKGGMKRAAKSGSKNAIIVFRDTIAVKNMATGSQTEYKNIQEFVEIIL